ncbi:MAG: DUF1269 domain-containing protein [Nitrococcus sp.]|nr:DUF1269 domain-containing protein [Nitrococcus sp.]
MKRLYFLLPNVETTRGVVHELLLNHVEERYIHVVAREGTPLEELPEASLGQKSDVLPAAEKGMVVGGATGAIAGLAAAAIPAAGVVAAGAALVFMTTAGGAGLGAWASSMIGISADSSRLKKFHEALEAGEILVLVDVTKGRVDEIEELIRKHHPKADIQGTEATIPNFP